MAYPTFYVSNSEAGLVEGGAGAGITSTILLLLAANVGGLMGLFLGFSFLSIAECIYFAFIRPCRICTEFREQRTVSTLELAKASSHSVAAEQPKLAKLRLNTKLMPNMLGQLQRQRQRQRELQQQRHLSYISAAAWFKTELGPQFNPA